MVLHEEGATVHLPELLSEEELDDSIVLAKLKGHHGHATLFNCYGSWTRDSDGSIVKARVSSTLVALGCAREEIGGEALAFRIPGSERWLDDECFQVSHGEGGDVSISLKAWERHQIPLSPDLMIDRTYTAAISSETSGVESYSIERKMRYEIRSNSWLTLDEHWSLLWALQRFFEFVTQSRLSYGNIKIYDHEADRADDSGASIHYVRPASEASKTLNRSDFLIHAHEVREQVNDLICGWMRLIKMDPAPFYQYFHAFDRRRQDRVLHFVWNVAAVEELHKMRYGRRDGKRKVYLKDRLMEMVRRWKDAFNQPPQDAVLQHIADSRHYHAHAAGDLRDRAAKGWLLLRYGDFLMALSNLELLSLIGLEQHKVISLIRHNLWMREALDLTTYPGPDG